jgi:hypothetical protein
MQRNIAPTAIRPHRWGYLAVCATGLPVFPTSRTASNRNPGRRVSGNAIILKAMSPCNEGNPAPVVREAGAMNSCCGDAKLRQAECHGGRKHFLSLTAGSYTTTVGRV